MSSKLHKHGTRITLDSPIHRGGLEADSSAGLATIQRGRPEPTSEVKKTLIETPAVFYPAFADKNILKNNFKCSSFFSCLYRTHENLSDSFLSGGSP